MTALESRSDGSQALSGARKAAILCIALGADASARILKHLRPEEVEQVTREIARIESVDEELAQAVLTEFEEASVKGVSSTHGGVRYAREVLETALGGQQARSVMQRVEEQIAATDLPRLRRSSPETLLLMLRSESPQTMALVIAHLDPKRAGAMIRSLEPERAGEVLYRMARLDRVGLEVLQSIEASLGSFPDLSLGGESESVGGAASVAKLLNQLPGTMDQDLLEVIGRRSGEISNQIRELMFVFEDLRLLDAKGMQRLLREVETRELALALKAASEPLRQMILKNMSERAGGSLLEEMEMLGAVKVKDVEAAHASIIRTVRDLQAEGELDISRGGDDAFIA